MIETLRFTVTGKTSTEIRKTAEITIKRYFEVLDVQDIDWNIEISLESVEGALFSGDVTAQVGMFY